MGKKRSGFWGISTRQVQKAIADWQPGDSRTEAQCKNSLARFLKDEFPKAEVIKEYGIGRLRIDIYMNFRNRFLQGPLGPAGKECFIEIKYDFQSRAKLQRLIGQVHQYVNVEAYPLFVVFCGEGESNSIEEFQEFLRKQNDKLDWEEQHLRFVNKSVEAVI